MRLAPIIFILELSTTAYAYIVACLHGKGIDNVLHLAAHVLEYPAFMRQDEHQGFLDLVQALGTTAL